MSCVSSHQVSMLSFLDLKGLCTYAAFASATSVSWPRRHPRTKLVLADSKVAGEELVSENVTASLESSQTLDPSNTILALFCANAAFSLCFIVWIANNLP